MVLDIKKTVADDACALTRAILQMFAMLDLYQAELASILHLKCGEAGELAAAQRELEPAGEAWEQALLLVRFYRALYVKKWRRGGHAALVAVEHPVPGGVPHVLIVDNDGLPAVVTYLEQRVQQADVP
jgi:hypothetical protein